MHYSNVSYSIYMCACVTVYMMCVCMCVCARVCDVHADAYIDVHNLYYNVHRDVQSILKYLLIKNN